MYDLFKLGLYRSKIATWNSVLETLKRHWPPSKLDLAINISKSHFVLQLLLMDALAEYWDPVTVASWFVTIGFTQYEKRIKGNFKEVVLTMQTMI